MTIHRTIVICLIALLTFPTGALADTFVTVDTTQNGGVFNNNAPTLVISHLTNDPLFTLTNGASTSNIEALIVGNLDGESGQLLIEDGSSLNNDGSGLIGTYGTESVLGGYAYLGLNADSSGSATVTGPGSTWTNSGIFNIGHSGNGTLNITNGGVVTNGLTYVGSNAGGVGHVTVTGAGSELISASANIVGVYGEGTLDVLDGARVYTPTGYIGLEAGSMGTVTVSGSGSTWENAADLNIGLAGTGELNLNNGGYVTSQNSDIGLSLGGNGTVNLSGVSTLWENANSLTVANEGTGLLNVDNGSKVTSEFLDIGLASGSNGIVNISNGGLIELTDRAVVGDAGNGQLHLMSASGLTADTVYVGGSEIEYTGGEADGYMTITGGSIVNSRVSVVALNEGSEGTIEVTGPGSQLNQGDYLNLGFNGSGKLLVSDGASVTSDVSNLGSNTTGEATVTLTGADSTWVNSAHVRVGRAGLGTLNVQDGAYFSSNELLVSGNNSGLSILDGGQLDVGTATFGFHHYSGFGESGLGFVDGPGSVFNVSELNVGEFGHGAVEVTNGGQVNAQNVFVATDGGEGKIVVDGVGSRLDLTEDIYIGQGIDRGDVIVTGGAEMTSRSAFIGNSPNASALLVVGDSISSQSGFESHWTNSMDMVVGNEGYGQLRIDYDGVVSTSTLSAGNQSEGLVWVNRGTLLSNIAYIGHQTNGEGDVAVRHGSWENTGDIYVGYEGVGYLDADFGGTISTGGDLFVGFNNRGDVFVYGGSSHSSANVGGDLIIGANASGNGRVAVVGNAQLTSGNLLQLGAYGSGELTVSGSAQVTSANGEIGRFSGAVGTATVQGESARWDIGQDLKIGVQGAGQLEVLGQGNVIVGRNIEIGSDATGVGILTINGIGSRLDIGDFFDVGRYGTGTFNIEDGGLVVSPSGGINGHYESFIGHFAGSTGVAMVTGDGSRWEMSRSLTIGSEGNGTLNILDGGYVTNHFSFIGANDGSVGSVTVDGEGSLWDSRNYIRMDETSSLTISNQGHVTTPWAADIAYDADSIATVLVTGENSKLTVGGFVVGRFGHGTMNIDNGGYASAVTGTLVGFAGTGITRVKGARSHLDINSLTVGSESGGNGTLEVLNGGLVTTNSATSIAHRAGSIGRIDVDGVGSTLQVGYDLYIGTDGAAQFNITDGGHVIVDNNAWLGANQVDPIATVSGTGSKWSINNGLLIGPNTNTISTVDILNGGLVTVHGPTRVYNNDVLNVVGGTLMTGSLNVDAGGTFNLDGGRLLLDGGVAEGMMYTAINGSRIGGTGTINELMIGAGGVLMPGDSPGLLHVNVGELLGDGIYEWEINSVNGLAGESIGWDLVTFETLQLSASDNDEFVIQINSLTEMNNNGRLADFDPFSSYTWLIAASDDVDPFDVDSFALDLAEFDNLFFDGNFTLSSGAANYGGFAHGLFLNYTAATVPEPNSLAVLLIALALANPRRRRVNPVNQNLH